MSPGLIVAVSPVAGVGVFISIAVFAGSLPECDDDVHLRTKIIASNMIIRAASPIPPRSSFCVISILLPKIKSETGRGFNR